MSACVWGGDKAQSFNSLNQDKVLNAIESLGYNTTTRVLVMASMENRVYEVEIYNDQAKHSSERAKIIKFYRPGRWTKEQIQDEHDFLFDLIENDITAIAPHKFDGESVFENEDGLYFCLFPKQGGRAADEWNDELLQQMGRLLARVHSTGLVKKDTHRLSLDVKTFGEQNLELILKNKYIPFELKSEYKIIADEIFSAAKMLYSGIKLQRIHGDCHHGNILLSENRPFLIDFDDMSLGPRVQDLWMITPARDEYSKNQFNILLDSYHELTDFNFKELKIIEVLRALRIIHFSAWIGHRYEDQSFVNAFPQYTDNTYWYSEIQDLKQQLNFINQTVNSTHSF